ncbi:MAG: L,D-transpeptidase [Muribaculaceae bacterium]|nr:L,D-transpeptidase [Muribaculaceae bacterium]
MNFTRLYLVLGITVFVLTLGLGSGCSGSETRYESEVDTVSAEDVDGAPLIQEETLITDTVPPNKPTLPSRRFKSASEALTFIEESADADKYRQGIIVDMIDDCLDYADRLLSNTHDHFIVVDKASMHVILYDRFGREEKAYRMACGKNYGTKQRKADSRTPEGIFYAVGIYDSTDWLFTDDNGVTSKVKGQFGPRFIRLSTPQIGIHGTRSPGSLGNRVSHGCIRISNDNIRELANIIDPGTPIIVNPSQRDMTVNRAAGIDKPFIRTGRSKLPDEEAIEAGAEKIRRQDSIAAARVADSIAAAVNDSVAKAFEADNLDDQHNDSVKTAIHQDE